jgi:hypothetical protein
MFIQVPVLDSVLSVRDQVCLGTQTPGTNYHLTDDFGALGDLHPLWGAIGCVSRQSVGVCHLQYVGSGIDCC